MSKQYWKGIVVIDSIYALGPKDPLEFYVASCLKLILSCISNRLVFSSDLSSIIIKYYVMFSKMKK